MENVTTESNLDMMFTKDIILNDKEWVVVSATIKYCLNNLLDPKSDTADTLRIIRNKIINAE